jgi:hypothetical protein
MNATDNKSSAWVADSLTLKAPPPPPPPQYSVTFLETGLGTGTAWSVTLAGSTIGASAPGSVSFTEVNGTYGFTVGSIGGYSAAPPSGSDVVNGNPVTTTIAFTQLATTYPVTFGESGLASGTNWSVTVGGSPASATAPSGIGISLVNGTYPFELGAVSGYTGVPASGSVTVSGTAVNKTVHFTAIPTNYSVTFTVTGLPGGTIWGVSLNGTNGSTSAPASVTFSEENGTFPYSVSAEPGYLATPSSGSVPVSGAAVIVPVAFTIAPGTYNATFNETGLASGQKWGVTLAHVHHTATAPSGLVFLVQNGNINYTIPAVPGYLSNVANGTLVVNGSATFVNITFSPFVATYSVTFVELGLSGGTSWSVSLNGTQLIGGAPNPIVFNETNGSYPFLVGGVAGYTSAPGSGTVVVAGTSWQRTITFTANPTTYAVDFTESGLRLGTTWSVTLGGSLSSAPAPSPIVFSETNGTYPYSIASVAWYIVAPATGSVVVSGAPVPVSILFNQTYNVTFTETGLRAGTSWSVTLAGSLVTANAPNSAPFVEINGTYPFTLANVPRYTVSPPSGAVPVAGHSVTEGITFTLIPSTYPVSFTESGLVAGTGWSVTVGGVINSATAPSAIGLSEANGTYTFTVGAITGLGAFPASGKVTVQGRNVSALIAFAPSSPFVQHVVVIVLENQELSAVMKGAPYMAYLSNKYGSATQFYGACHNSLPEYVAMTSGRAFGCSGIGIEKGLNIADLLETAGLSWDAYFEGMPTACDRTTQSSYSVDHNPFLHYKDVVSNANRCAAHLVNSAGFNQSVANGTLPTFSYYIPNLYNDCHSSSLAFCDGWLKSFLAPMINGTGPRVMALMAHTAFVVLFDEGKTNLGYSVGGIDSSWCQNTTGHPLSVCGGHTYLTIVSPYSVGLQDTASTTDYNVESTIEWLFTLSNDGGYDGTTSFPSMSSLFTFSTNG